MVEGTPWRVLRDGAPLVNPKDPISMTTIVKSVVKAHRGALQLEARDGGGLRVIVRLPPSVGGGGGGAGARDRA